MKGHFYDKVSRKFSSFSDVPKPLTDSPTGNPENVFLQSVPIFEDFDSEKDKNSLEVYVVRFQTDKGIHLPRHRFVLGAGKP